MALAEYLKHGARSSRVRCSKVGSKSESNRSAGVFRGGIHAIPRGMYSMDAIFETSTTTKSRVATMQSSKRPKIHEALDHMTCRLRL